MSVVINGTTGITTPAVDSNGTIDLNNNILHLNTDESQYINPAHISDGNMLVHGGSGLFINLNNSTNDIALFTNNVQRFTVNVNGQVTMPAQPAFSATKSGAATHTNATITFTNAVVNVGSHYNTANSRFTAPVAGTYYFLYDGLTNNNTETGDYRFYKNGADTNFATYANSIGNTSYKKTVGSMVITLAASDYIEVRALGTNTIYGSATAYHTRFLGYLIG